MTTRLDRKSAAAQQWVRDFADLLIIGATDDLDLGALMTEGLAVALSDLGEATDTTARGHLLALLGECTPMPASADLGRLRQAQAVPGDARRLHMVDVVDKCPR